MHQEYLYDSVYKTLGPELIYNRIRWYGFWIGDMYSDVQHTMVWKYFGMTHIYGMTGISYWYVVLAGMDSWNEELYLQNTIPWYGKTLE